MDLCYGREPLLVGRIQGEEQGKTGGGDEEGEREGRVQGGGPNDVSFGPQVHFFLLLFVLFTNNMFSLIRIYTNDTHCCEPLLAGWWIPYPAAYETTPRATACGVDPPLCHQVQGVSLPLPGPPQLLRQAHDNTAASNCSRGGSLPCPPTTMTTTWCHHRRQLLYSKGLAIAGPPRCRSYTTGDGGSTRTHLTRGS